MVFIKNTLNSRKFISPVSEDHSPPSWNSFILRLKSTVICGKVAMIRTLSIGYFPQFNLNRNGFYFHLFGVTHICNRFLESKSMG